MTRPKVPDDKRIRTAQACESCKRRKQKCNGLRPCNTCTKRNLVCEYIPHDGHLTNHNVGQGSIVVSSSSPPKRRKSTSDTAESGEEPASKRLNAGDSQTPQDQEQAPSHQTPDNTEPSSFVGLPTPIPPPHIPGQPARGSDSESRSRQSTASGADEVAEVYTETRMLQDPTGRLLYLGDSATLSYLQFIRVIVESVDGPSQFTMDPSRHRLMESTSSLPPGIRAPHLLPDRNAADVLIRSYFTNTSGLVEIFDRKAFIARLDVCYQDPLAAESTFLCLLYLVFAIGLVLATPLPGSPDDVVIRKLNAGHADRAEIFLRNAKALGDPTSGFEDADFWSVQALLLISIYMLARTKRNAAYAYHGMAVRSGYALGLHRQETMVIFPIPDRAERRNVWRSLYVLDRFLAAALGRPTSISEEDCSADALVTPEKYLADTRTDSSVSGGLDTAVRTCQVIGMILKMVYAQRKISTRLAQDIAEQCKGGPHKYHPGLHWREAMNKAIEPGHGMAVLHVNLLYCHAVILLTRPFFLFLMNRMQQERLGFPRANTRPGSRMERFSEACVNASYHTITLVHMILEGKYLPQRDPFVIHFLFAAALVVQSNEFARLHKHPAYHDSIQKAMSVMSYCAKSDPQAVRLVYILSTFHHVLVARAPVGSSLRDSSIPNTPPGGISSASDPMANFFFSHPITTPTGNPPTSVLFTSATSQPQQPPPCLTTRNSGNVAGPSPSPGMMTTALTPTTPAAGDLLNEAEWFHFDTLWENWGPPGNGPGAASSSAVNDPTIFADATLNSFDISGAGGPSFATSPMPPIPPTRGVNGGGVVQMNNVPLYPMTRFTE